ncbi:XrtA/PEP-CTERM system TPR-repeat protein PrsT [Uliginosibacterium sp. sgz301328]|uniref:XrtA/PEP-CTERM system TPR-repeat protein PrsT n=1 Tax=Uliginosibacterium sp. sgz301328 TaxID=3243764 RepID=UPI00359F0A45
MSSQSLHTMTTLLRTMSLTAVLAMLTACSSGDPDKLLGEARQAIAKRDYATAIIQIKNVLQQDAGNGQARVLFAQALLEQRDATGALDELRKAQSAGFDPEQVAPLTARALGVGGQWQKVVDEFAHTQLKTAAGNANLAVEVARAYMMLGKREDARRQFERAAQAQPDNVEAELGAARIALMDRDVPTALGITEMVMGRHPNEVEPQLLRAELLIVQNRVPDAIAQFEKVTQARPDDPRAYGRLVALYIGLNELDKAQTNVEALVKVSPGTLQTVYFQSVLALRQGKWVAARDGAAKVLRAVPDYQPALVVAGSANIRLNDQLQAQAMLKKVVKAQPDAAMPRRLLAESYVAARNADDALATLAPLKPETSDSPDLLNLVGQAYLLKGDFERSTEAFTRLAQLRPNSAQARINLGLARMYSGDESAGMHELEAATKLDATRVQVDAAIVAAQLRKGDTKEALATLDALEKRQPDNPLTYTIKGQVMLAVNRPADARTAFERAAQLQPGNLEAAIQLARLDVADKKVDAARQRFIAIVEKEPKNVRAWTLLARLQQDTGAPDKEVQGTLEKAVDADPTQNEARVALVQLLLKGGKSKEALTVAQQARAANPDTSEVMALLGRTQLAAGVPQQAVSTFGKLQTLQPNNPVLLADLSTAQLAAGDKAGAEQSLRRALELNGDFREAQQRLLALMLADKRYDDALAYSRGLQKADPNDVSGYLFEARVQAESGHKSESTAAWQQAYKRSRTAAAAIGLHSAYMAEGRKDDAQRVANEWIAANPRDVTVRTYLGMRATDDKRYADAMTQYQAVVAVAPNSPVVLNNMAWIANQTNDARAVEYAEKALAAAPNAPEVMETAGSVFVAHGQEKRGLELLRQAVALAPKAADIRLGYARALAHTGDKSAARKELQAATDSVPDGNVALRTEIDAFAKTL